MNDNAGSNFNKIFSNNNFRENITFVWNVSLIDGYLVCGVTLACYYKLICMLFGAFLLTWAPGSIVRPWNNQAESCFEYKPLSPAAYAIDIMKLAKINEKYCVNFCDVRWICIFIFLCKERYRYTLN